MAMEYGQQAFSAMQSAEAARAAEAAMNEAAGENEDVATQGDAPDTSAAIKEQSEDMAARYQAGPDQFAEAPASDEDDEEPMLKGAALKARADELGIPSGLSADETRAAIADAEGSGSELHGDA